MVVKNKKKEYTKKGYQEKIKREDSKKKKDYTKKEYQEKILIKQKKYYKKTLFFFVE